MKKTTLFVALLAVLLTAIVSSCSQGGGTAASSSSASTSDSVALPDLKGNVVINRATRFYAGISKDGVNISAADAQAWEKYSQEIKGLLAVSERTRSMVDSLVRTDFSDFRDKVDVVFYPFSGADFLYPTTIFPDADTYIMLGLERTGTVFGENIKTNYAQYESYRKALSYFLQKSYFITKYMAEDFYAEDLDGVCPVMTMLMATAGYEIISIENKKFDENGKLTDGEGKGNVMQYKFFRTGSKHEQTLYYISGDVQDASFKPEVKKFIEAELKGHTVASYLKAASYLLHNNGFSAMRNYVLDNSQYIIQDDSGMPYRYLVDKFDVTLYGVYKHPLEVFGNSVFQHDMDKEYRDNASTIHSLPFRIGYNNPSNWQCARRKK